MATTTTTVTQEQIDACTRVIDFNDHCRIFYQVRSERDPLVEYIVRYEYSAHNPNKGYFTCTCPAGQEGFIHCSQGTCKHVRWALAAEDAYKAERKARKEAKARMMRQWEQDRKRFLVDGKPVDYETYERVMTAKPHQYTEGEIKRDQARYASSGFRLLK